MYKIGDIVLYGKQGLCRIENIGPISITSANSDIKYYTLIPIYGTGKTYTPVDTTVHMRPAMTFQEVQEIIKKIPTIKEKENDVSSREMAEYYKSSLNSLHWEDLVQLIKTIYVKSVETKKQGKKLGQTEERYKKEAEEILYQEFAVALDIEYDDVEKYIFDAIEKNKSVV